MALAISYRINEWAFFKKAGSTVVSCGRSTLKGNRTDETRTRISNGFPSSLNSPSRGQLSKVAKWPGLILRIPSWSPGTRSEVLGPLPPNRARAEKRTAPLETFAVYWCMSFHRIRTCFSFPYSSSCRGPKTCWKNCHSPLQMVF